MNASGKSIRSFYLLLAVLGAGAAVRGETLPQDPLNQSGTLANGVKWMYRQHDNPPGKMALMMHVRSGSLNETDNQRGLAHFLEHMCFNGTENFPPGKLIPYFESIGMEFGADLNAFTSFDQTSYMLFTPDTSSEQIGKALMVLSDYAFRATLLEEEIDKERGIVLEEARSGKNAFQRIRDKLWPELFEGSRFARRLPIGDETVIATAGRDEFVDYYKTWYRPENITVLVVGDTKSDEVVPLIDKWFGGHKHDAPARPQMRSEFKPFTKERALVATDPEMSLCRVQMTNILPGRPPTTTVPQWRTELVEYIGTWIVNRRLQERIDRGEASYRNARADVESFFNDAVLVDGTASGEPDEWQDMLGEVIEEVHRAREFGFVDRELALAKKEILAEGENLVKIEPTRNARGFLFEMLGAVNDRTPVLSAQQQLDLYKAHLPSVSLSEVSETFKNHFAPGTFAYVVTMKEGDGVAVPSSDEVLAAAKSAWAKPVQPPSVKEAPTELLAAIPAPGKVVESSTDKDLEITSAWLSNGVRVHHRPMDYKKDSIWMSINLAGGNIEETAANANITEVATLAVNEAATGRLSSTDFRDLMTGKNISLRAVNARDSLGIEITGDPDELETGLQAAHALLTDGKIEESAFKNWKLRTLQQIDMFNTMPRVKAMEAMQDLLSGGDPRQLFPTKATIEPLALGDAQAWYDRMCRGAPIEVAIVGDISWEKVRPLVETYIGSLAERPRGADHLKKLRKLARNTGPLSREVKVETVTPQAMVYAGFVGTEGVNRSDTRAMELAQQVLTSRLVKRIREELSIVYSIRGSHNPSWIYEDAGRFVSGAPCDPANAQKVIEEVHRMFQEFAESGPTEEELDNAKKQVANNLDTSMREPTYWWSILRNHDLHRRDLNEEKAEKEAFPKFTTEQVQKVFRKYYTPERQFSIWALPTGEKAETGDKPKSDAGT